MSKKSKKELLKQVVDKVMSNYNYFQKLDLPIEHRSPKRQHFPIMLSIAPLLIEMAGTRRKHKQKEDKQMHPTFQVSDNARKMLN